MTRTDSQEPGFRADSATDEQVYVAVKGSDSWVLTCLEITWPANCIFFLWAPTPSDVAFIVAWIGLMSTFLSGSWMILSCSFKNPTLGNPGSVRTVRSV